MQVDAGQIRKRFSELTPKYQNLALNLKQALELFLHNAGISYLTIDHRIKDLDSFTEKIRRKKYADPFDQMEDICGLRIICYYTSDLEKICETIKREFIVIESTDKEDLLKPDQFGYRSHHLVVKIKEGWLNAPNYRGLEDLKEEIQIRTVLMHAWAEIQHKLAYKKKTDIPSQFHRQLSRMAAKLEETDEQFEELRNRTEKYRSDLIEKAKKEEGIFEKSLPLNLDNLQAFLDYHFPNRQGDMQETRVLLDELMQYRIDMRQLVESYQKVKDYLSAIEEEVFGPGKVGKGWTQHGAVRTVLDLTLDRYAKRLDQIRTSSWGQTVAKWKDLIESERSR